MFQVRRYRNISLLTELRIAAPGKWKIGTGGTGADPILVPHVP